MASLVQECLLQAAPSPASQQLGVQPPPARSIIPRDADREYDIKATLDRPGRRLRDS